MGSHCKMVFNNCCCCIELRTGCIIIGVLQILGGLGNFKPPLEWFTILLAIVSIISGCCLLFGSIKYNPIGILINLIFTAITSLFCLIVAIMIFYAVATYHTSREEFIGYMIAGGVYLVALAINVYLWLCVFSFYKKLKSGDITSPA